MPLFLFPHEPLDFFSFSAQDLQCSNHHLFDLSEDGSNINHGLIDNNLLCAKIIDSFES